jgi:DNA-binding NarL/FixJ family response regulator
MPDVSGTDVITQIRHRWPEMKVVVLSESDDRTTMDRVMAAGASAYLLKTVNPVDLPSVIRQVAAGAIFLAPARAVVRESDPVREALTERERTILAAISSGRTTSAISRELWVSEHTIKFHLTNIYRKLGVSNRAGAIRFAMEHGLAA